jgi:antitoxin HicB
MPIKCHCEEAEAISTLNLHLEIIRYKLNEKLIPIFDNCPKFNYNQGKRLPGDKNLVKIGGLKMSIPQMIQMISYRILLRKEPEGGYTITVPSLPGCVTYGKSIEEGIKMAKEAIVLYLESLKLHDEEIPTDEGVLEYTLTVGANV